MFSGLYLHNDVTCQKMRTRFCNLTIKDSKNVNLKVPAQNQKRRKLVAFKVDWSQKRLHGHVVFKKRLIIKACDYELYFCNIDICPHYKMHTLTLSSR